MVRLSRKMPFGIIDTELKDGGQIPGTEMLIGGSRAGVEAEMDDGHLEKITYRACTQPDVHAKLPVSRSTNSL